MQSDNESLTFKKRFILIGESVLVFLFLRYSPALLIKNNWLFFATLLLIVILLFFTNFNLYEDKRVGLRIALLLDILLISLLLFEFFFNEKSVKIVSTLGSIIFLFLFLGLQVVWQKEPSLRDRFFSYEASVPIFASVIILFFISYSLYAAKILFSVINFFGLVALFFLLFAVINYLNLSLWDLHHISHRASLLVGGVILLELFIVLGFAPIPVAARSAIIATAYYMFSSIIYIRSLPVFDRKMLQTHAAISLISFFLILLTAQWI